jgi:hypothetical protein
VIYEGNLHERNWIKFSVLLFNVTRRRFNELLKNESNTTMMMIQFPSATQRIFFPADKNFSIRSFTPHVRLQKTFIFVSFGADKDSLFE